MMMTRSIRGLHGLGMERGQPPTDSSIFPMRVRPSLERRARLEMASAKKMLNPDSPVKREAAIRVSEGRK